MLTINSLSCTIQKRNILNSISLQVPDNEILGITGGPSCGKSLLLSIIAGSYKKFTGEILYNETAPDADKQEESGRLVSHYSFSGCGYSPEATVFDTVISGRRKRKSIFRPYTDTDRESAEKCITRLKLEEYSAERLKNVSESIVRMSLVASAMMSECGLLLLDSPEAGSGYRQRADLAALIKKHTASGRNTVIIASADLNFLAAVCDRIIVLEKGKVAAEGTAEIINEKFMKRFFNIDAMISRNVVTSLPEIHVIES